MQRRPISAPIRKGDIIIINGAMRTTWKPKIKLGMWKLRSRFKISVSVSPNGF